MASDPNGVSPERRRRRRYDPAFKRALVEQTQPPGASVPRIACKHAINANQLFKWRRQLLLAEQASGLDSLIRRDLYK
jgi:transposase-like protein